ncbi:MAG TPA: molybdopterin-dependent oxidoreductase [Nitrososphaerales archaeon]|nr:molybdopterin-dependent oxidoreductase [Nitrososphaerales archaeon]
MRITRRSFVKYSALAATATYVALSFPPGHNLLKALDTKLLGQSTPANSTTTTIRTAHSNNCDGSCGLVATVVGGNIVRFSDATFNMPNFPSRICLRGLSQLQYVYHPDRIKYPMQQVGQRGSGQWQQISWDQATTIIANKLSSISSQYGSKSIYIAPYTGNLAAINGLIGVGYRFASVIGASAGDFEGDNEGDSASPAGAVEELGGFDGHELTDLLNARMIVLWGNNLAETDIPDMRFVLDARDSGTKVVYIDPRHTSTAQLSDQWITIRPGTDGALALGMINVIINENLYNQNYITSYTVAPFLVRQDTGLFLREGDVVSGGSSKKYMVYDSSSSSAVTSDTTGATPALTGSYTINGITCKPAFQLLSEMVSKYDLASTSTITGIDQSTIKTFAEQFAAANPAAIKAGFGGISHWYYGDLTYRAMITLSALCGYIGVHGGGVTTYNGALLDSAIDLSDWITPDKKSYSYLPPLSFCDAVLSGNPYPIKAAWFPCDNFVNQQGDTNRTIKALQALDFVVVSDVFMTPTARYADIVLPVATQYEKEDILLGGNMYLQYLPQIIQPLWESKSDLDMFGMVAQKMGQGSYFNQTTDDYISLLLSGLPSGLTLDTLKSQGVVRLDDKDFASAAYQPITHPYVPFYQQNFPTPSGRIEFYVESLVPYNQPLPTYQEPLEASPSNPLFKKYPLVLITSHTKFRTHTQWNNLAWLRELNPKQFIEINPDDAASRGINDGDAVTVFNDRGSITTLARVTSGMRPGVVNIYQGDWQEFPNGTVNMLTHQKINPAQSVVFLFQSNTAYFDVLVDVKKS